MTDNSVTRFADLLRMPVGERRAALRSLVSKAAVAAPLRREVKAATAMVDAGTREDRLTSGWQDRVLARVRESESALEIEAQNARELLAKLLDLPHARRETLVRNSRRFHNWSLCQLLTRESLEALFREPKAGLEIALLAVEIADSERLSAPSDALRNDLRGTCWSYLGNAYRALSRFQEAEAAFAKSAAHLKQGTGDPVDLGRLTDFRAMLRVKQRRFPEAERLFDRAVRAFLSVGDRHLAGASIVGKALVLLETGATRESMLLNRQALEMLSAERNARLPIIARHNLAVALKSLGAFEDALEEIRKLRPAHASLGDTMSLVRLSYLQAEVEFGMGLCDRAIARLGEVRDEFARHEMPFDVAVATLDLAAFHLQLNQLAECKRLASESLPLFRSLGIHREAIAAFLVFQQAAEREAATVDLVREIAGFLRASRTNPELKFRA